MREFQYLTPIDEMPKINAKELGERFEEILDDVNKTNRAYAITVESENKYVLAPASWFNYCFDDDFGCVVNSAIRYALRRYTYMPGVVADFVKKYVHLLDTNTIKVAIEDIEKELKMPQEMPHEDIWVDLKNALLCQEEKMNLSVKEQKGARRNK